MQDHHDHHDQRRKFRVCAHYTAFNVCSRKGSRNKAPAEITVLVTVIQGIPVHLGGAGFHL